MTHYTIGFVLDDSLDRPDGVQQYVTTVGEWLRGQGHDVHYLVSESNRTDIAQIHSLGRNMSVRFNGNCMRMPLPASKRAIRKLLSSTPFDILHVQMPYSPFLAGRIIRAANARTAVVGTFHIVPDSWVVGAASRVLAQWCRPTLQRFDKVVSVSDAAQDFAHRAFGLETSIVPNAVPLARFRNAVPLHDNRSTEQRVLFLGRLVPRKGCQLLLEAVEILLQDKSVPPFMVTICGKGLLIDQLQEYARTHDLSSHVSFTGFVSEEEKVRYYASSDITVFPSTGGESFGIVLVEAMAHGNAAVLAGDNPGYRYVLAASPGEVLFDPRNPKALAERLKRLLTDDTQRRQISSWQRQHAEQFDVGHVGKQIEDVYALALRHRRGL